MNKRQRKKQFKKKYGAGYRKFVYYPEYSNLILTLNESEWLGALNYIAITGISTIKEKPTNAYAN